MFTERESLLGRLIRILDIRLIGLSREMTVDLMRRLGHIRETGMRRRSLLRELARIPAAVALEVLCWIGTLARDRIPEAQILYLDLLDERIVREALGEERIADIWRLGRLKGYRQVLESFFYTTGIDGRLDERPTLPPDIRDIPLGTRKSMARQGGIYILERLLRDNDVNVIEKLLANPRITEREVIRIAARRPNSPGIISAVASDRRWVSRYAVKKALVYNPFTPVNISVPLVRFLVRQDLLELCRHTSANEVLKNAARQTLEGRGQTTPP